MGSTSAGIFPGWFYYHHHRLCHYGFNQWPAVSRTILVLLTFCGACAGSTGGGIKISRLLLLAKSVRKELHLYLHPNAVKKIKMDGKAVSHEVMRATNIYMIVYLMLMAVSIFLISF